MCLMHQTINKRLGKIKCRYTYTFICHKITVNKISALRLIAYKNRRGMKNEEGLSRPRAEREGGRASKCRPTAAGVPVPDKAEDDDDGDNEAVGVSD